MAPGELSGTWGRFGAKTESNVVQKTAERYRAQRDKRQIFMSLPRGQVRREKTVVVIEVKGCWHPDLKTSMETQLVNRYLRDNFYTHGGSILVGGFAARSGKKRMLREIIGAVRFRLSKSVRLKSTFHDQRRERPHRAAKSRPDPPGFGGHSRLLLPEDAARVLAAQEKGIRKFVRRDVRQNRKGGTKTKHGNHQSTTQATKVSDDPGASRGVGENTARSIRKVHRFYTVITEALKVLFKRDDEFKAWLGQHANDQNPEQNRGEALTKTAYYEVPSNTIRCAREHSVLKTACLAPHGGYVVLDVRCRPESFATSTADSSLGIPCKQA